MVGGIKKKRKGSSEAAPDACVVAEKHGADAEMLHKSNLPVAHPQDTTVISEDVVADRT